MFAQAATFRHGVHPPEHKHATEGLTIERMGFVPEYVLPLSQHIGAPSKPVVSVGDKVVRGQLLAGPGGFISTSLHAPVTGTVTAIELRRHPNGKEALSLVLTTDPFASQRFVPTGPLGIPNTTAELVQRVQDAGIVGLGGAAFPSHVKLAVPEGKKVRFVLLNGCECEPYLTCDHRVMVERPDAVVRGLRIAMAQLNAEKAWIGVENNKPDAIKALRNAADGDPTIEIVGLEVKYPQGAEKMLIDAVLHKEVPSGKLPLDLEIVVHNVGTAAALADLFDAGTPLIERVVTVTGPGIRRPANVLVPIGTPVRALVEHCGGLLPGVRQVILGGPMMGMAQKTLDVPVTKGTSGVLALIDPARDAAEQPCIRCGRCLEACPMHLNPQRLALMVRNERAAEVEALHITDCFECASCSFACPSNLPLVQWMRVGKGLIKQKKAVS